MDPSSFSIDERLQAAAETSTRLLSEHVSIRSAKGHIRPRELDALRSAIAAAENEHVLANDLIVAAKSTAKFLAAEVLREAIDRAECPASASSSSVVPGYDPKNGLLKAPYSGEFFEFTAHYWTGSHASEQVNFFKMAETSDYYRGLMSLPSRLPQTNGYVS